MHRKSEPSQNCNMNYLLNLVWNPFYVRKYVLFLVLYNFVLNKNFVARINVLCNLLCIHICVCIDILVNTFDQRYLLTIDFTWKDCMQVYLRKYNTVYFGGPPWSHIILAHLKFHTCSSRHLHKFFKPTSENRFSFYFFCTV